MKAAIVRPSVAAILVCCLSVVGCSSGDPSGSQSVDVQTNQHTSTNAPSSPLPRIHIDVDEDGPVTVKESIDASDLVIIARVVGETGGARFFGGDDPENLAGDWTEVVSLHLEVDEYLKGDGAGDLAINWEKYRNASNSSDSRIAILHSEGVDRDLPIGNRFLMFLKNYGDPWGLITTSSASSLMGLDAEMRVSGIVSSNFDKFRGERLEDVLPDGFDWNFEGGS